MILKSFRKPVCRRRRSGIVLVMTVIVLVVLVSILYRLGANLSQWKHRQQYVIGYQKARYGCESGLKYALAVIDEIDPNTYVERPNEPDFSDLFAIGDEEYKEMIANWAAELEKDVDVNDVSKDDFLSLFASLSMLGESGEANDANGFDFGGLDEAGDYPDEADEDRLVIRGPYGPAWPYMTEVMEFDFGDSTVTVEVIDENAKLPLSWGISGDEEVEREAEAAFVSFCEWMQMEPFEISLLQKQLEAMEDIKYFSTALKPVVTIKEVEVKVKDRSPKRLIARSSRSSRSSRAKTVTRRTKVTRPDIGHTRDFAKLMHSPILDTGRLARPVNDDDQRVESALKYLSLWGTQRVNINSAPRHVLESAFMFGGDSVEIAQMIINERALKPFQNIEDLKKRLYSYNDSIEKSENYICTQSSYFSVRATAVSGVAKIVATVGIKQVNGKGEKIGFVME